MANAERSAIEMDKYNTQLCIECERQQEASAGHQSRRLVCEGSEGDER